MTTASASLRRAPIMVSSATLSALLLGAGLLSLTQGAMSLSIWESLSAIADAALGVQWSELAAYERAVVLELRVPRTFLAVFVGALLAQCGAVMQGLFRNPLADPGIVGVSAGAASGAVLAIFLGPESATAWLVPLAAFIGGFITSILVYGLARGPFGTSVVVLLLAGVAISALAGSLIAMVSYLSDDERLRDISLWQMGSLATADATYLYLAGAVFVALAIRFQKHAQALNALLLGESEARHLGINVERLKLELVLLVAVGVGVAVAAAGMIGFVGLVVPHAIRLTSGPDYRHLLPMAALGGAALLLLADAVSRVLIAPAEVPVGIMTALLGAPFFVFLLVRLRRTFR